MKTRDICRSHGPMGRLPLALLLLIRPATGRWLQEFCGKERTR
jgi:hypothetical protein